MDVYPFELVLLLLKATNQNRRLQSVDDAHAMTIAVCHSLDMGFNNGRGNILGDWTKSMLKDLPMTETEKEEGKQIISERTMAFFDSMPKLTRPKGTK